MSEDLAIAIGDTASESVTVTHKLTVAYHAPGMPEVYGTPMMIYLMEVASARAIRRSLPPGSVSVGTEVKIRHMAATPVGFVVTASATVIAVDGRTVTFAVQAHDGVELIGEGIHTRTVVNLDRFNERMAAKSRRVELAASEAGGTGDPSATRSPHPRPEARPLSPAGRDGASRR
jgi:predicted thioesterase